MPACRGDGSPAARPEATRIVPDTHFDLPMTYTDSDAIGFTTADAEVSAGQFTQP